MSTAPASTARPLDRRLFWLGVAVWAVASWLIGEAAAQHMKWRINDLSAVAGAGMIIRNPDGVFYHVASDDGATPIFRPSKDEPTDPVATLQSCGDCTVVTGEQMALTNDFCAAGVPAELPAIHFEVPCQSWAPINEGAKVMATVIFLVPLLSLPLLRMIIEARRERRRLAKA